MVPNQGLHRAAKLAGYLVWFIILTQVMFLSTDGPYTSTSELLGSHLGHAFWLLVLSLIPYFMARARAKKAGSEISWPYVMIGATVIALMLAVGGFYGKSQSKRQPIVVDSRATVESSTSPTIVDQQRLPQDIDPRDALLQMHVEQLSDDQYNAAVNRWLESHPEASSAESRSAMSQLLQEVYAQYPRSALGPALDMALQRGQRYASSNITQTPAQTFPANCIDYTSLAIPAKYSGARVTFNFKNVALKTFLQVIEQETNRRITAMDDVSVGITVCVINIPWDYALDKVLAENGYGQTEYNGAIRVFRRQ